MTLLYVTGNSDIFAFIAHLHLQKRALWLKEGGMQHQPLCFEAEVFLWV